MTAAQRQGLLIRFPVKSQLTLARGLAGHDEW